MDTLPNELLAKIARYVHQMRQQDPDPGIRALMTVSKRCSAVSKRFLYRSIRHQHLVHPALLKALQDPAVVQLIEQAELTVSLQEIPDFTKPFHALRYCTALTSLTLNYESIEDLASEVSDVERFYLRSTLPAVIEMQPFLTKLTSVEIRLSEDRAHISHMATETMFGWLRHCTHLNRLSVSWRDITMELSGTRGHHGMPADRGRLGDLAGCLASITGLCQ